MKHKNIIISIFFILLIGCEKEIEISSKSYPYIITKEVSNIDSTGVTLNAELLDNGKEEIIDFGFIWNNEETEYKYSLKNNGGALGNFTVRISSDLEAEQNYTCKAYIETTVHQIFGNTVTFESFGSKSPEILDFNPKIGFDTTEVVLTGKYFSLNNENNSVFVNNVKAKILYCSNDTIIFKTPKMPYYGDAEVSVLVGLKKVIATNKFQILGPQIESISSTSGHSGEYLTIKGNNFTQNGENTYVSFHEINAQILKMSATEIEVVVPAPSFNGLLYDNTASIEITNGLKSATYSEDYNIKKSWEQKQATPFSWGWKYQAFTYNEKGYILELNAKELYEYDPNLNQWNVISAFPGERHDGSLYIIHNQKLMKIGGYGGYYRYTDFWEYDFINDTWTQKTDIPFDFQYANYFILDNEIFIITTDSQVWKYNANNELFTRLNDFPTTFEFFVFSFTSNNIAYTVSSDKTWQYDKLNDSWINVASNSFSLQSYSQLAIGFGYKETGYVLQSGKDLYRFDVERNQWILSSNYPGPYGYNSYKTVFVINDKAYVAATSTNYSGGAPLMYSYQD